MRLRAYVLLLAAVSGYGLDPNRTLTQYVHRIWQVQQGLPESSIYSILQTSDGYLWLGTLSGLVRFDGVGFTPLETVIPSAPTGVWIRDLVEDSTGALWVGTNESGVFKVDHGTITRYTQKEGMPSDNVSSILLGRDGAVWAGTQNGLVRFADGKLQTYGVAQGLANNYVRSASLAGDGKMWIVTDAPQLNLWDGSNFTSRKLTSLPPDAAPRTVYAARDGTIYVGTTSGLIQIRNGQEHLLTIRDGLVDNWILTLGGGRDGSLWIGTRSGFSRLRNGEIDKFRPQEGLSQSTVFSVFEDREGSLWVGTKHGLNQFLDGRAVPYTVNEGLPTNDTGPVLQDKQGNIWVGTLGAGLTKFDGKRFTVLTTRQGLTSNYVHALAEDADGTLWAGTEGGLTELRDSRIEKTYTTAQGLPSNDIRSLLRDRSGALWIGTSGGAAALRQGSISRPAGLAVPAQVLAMGEDGGGAIYLATPNAVSVFSNGKTEELLQNGASLKGVDAFFRDQDGGLWMGLLGGGLRLRENGKISTFLMRDGLFDNEIYSIVDDGSDHLWMACSKGIYSVPRGDLKKFAAGQIRKFVSNPYSPTDALRVIESKPGVQPAETITHDGRLWVSTIRGLIVLDPIHQTRNLLPPSIVVEDVTVNGETETPSRIGALAPGRKNLEFRYTGLSFLTPNRITFRYILDGFDKDWIDAGTRRVAYYTNLPPGKYNFRVTGCGIDGVCNGTGSTVEFVLASHYYQRIWFFPSLVVLIALAGWLAYQLRIRRLREHFSLILSERNRIARELHDTLIQGLSGITMEMQALLGRLKTPDERGILEDIIQDAGTCLRETRRSVAGLRSGTSGLAAAIERAARQATEAKDVRLKLKLENRPSGLPADVEYNLVRIAQEAVMNSVKHSRARTVEVALEQNAKALHLSVKDDGDGFAGNGSAKSGHYGLIGMKERATHIGAAFDLASAPGRGTTISIVLPAGHHGSSHRAEVDETSPEFSSFENVNHE